MNFADKLTNSINESKSIVVAGFDPVLEHLPHFIRDSKEGLFEKLSSFYIKILPLLQGRVAAIKVNIAFFEQYGVEGLRAYAYIAAEIRERKIPFLVDAKRGDIGTTAESYANAFLGRGQRSRNGLDLTCDAITVNPFLGFDTLEPFVEKCRENDKGIFVLVRTSNPGAKDIQDLKVQDGTVSDIVAHWVAEAGEELIGASGFSSIGAVVGATYPEQAKHFRRTLERNYFLVPGFGAQGGTAEMAIAGLPQGKGGIVNASRLLFKLDPSLAEEEWLMAFSERVSSLNQQLQRAIEESYPQA